MERESEREGSGRKREKRNTRARDGQKEERKKQGKKNGICTRACALRGILSSEPTDAIEPASNSRSSSPTVLFPPVSPSSARFSRSLFLLPLLSHRLARSVLLLVYLLPLPRARVCHCTLHTRDFAARSRARNTRESCHAALLQAASESSPHPFASFYCY